MIESRTVGDVEIVQIIEFTGPTHDLHWMLPDMPRAAFDANADWLAPDFWMPATNRLVFTMQLWLLKASDRLILVDTGVGNGKKRASPYQNMINTPALDWLAAVGAPVDKITHVIHTHLHGDHVGWDTREDGGRWVPTFPNAVYYAPAADWMSFKSRHDAGTLGVHDGPFIDSVLPIADAGLLRLFEPGEQLADCLMPSAAPGHTAGQVTFSFRHAGERFIFAADVFHSPMQVQYPHVNSRWCELPDDARATRRALMQDAAATGATVYPAHAAGIDGWHIVCRDDGYVVNTRHRSRTTPAVPTAATPTRLPEPAHT